MKPTAPCARFGPAWAVRMLVACSLLLVATSLILAAAYFGAPQAWTLPLELWCYKHLPYSRDLKFAAAFLILALWLAGSCILLAKIAQDRRIPWLGLALAAFPPAWLLAYSTLFAYAASRIAPFSVGR